MIGEAKAKPINVNNAKRIKRSFGYEVVGSYRPERFIGGKAWTRSEEIRGKSTEALGEGVGSA
jgi:hypothetical protein